MYIKFSLEEEGMKAPTRSNRSDAGLDVYFNQADSHLSSITVHPGQNYLFATGCRFEIPHGYALMVKNRSGMASRHNLLKGAQLIDAGYSGVVYIDLHNVGEEAVTIKNGTKIAQLVLVPVLSFDLVQADKDDLYSKEIVFSERGEGGFGSTDSKK